MNSASQQQSSLGPTDADRRPKTSGDSRVSFFARQSHLHETKRDSAVAPSVQTAGNSSVTASPESVPQLLKPPQELRNVPSITLNDGVHDTSYQASTPQQRPYTAPGSSFEGFSTLSPAEEAFAPLTTSIETGAFDDLFSSSHLTFSKRGSVLVDGIKANSVLSGSRPGSQSNKKSPHLISRSQSRKSSIQSPSQVMQSPAPSDMQRTLSVSEKRLSRQLRSKYGIGEEEQGLGILPEQPPTEAGASGARPHDTGDVLGDLPKINLSPSGAPSGELAVPHNQQSGRSSRSSFSRLEPWEAAGGFEDWRDVDHDRVDRYGFITPTSADSLAPNDQPRNNKSERHSSHPSSPEEGSARHRKISKLPPSSFRSHRLSTTGASNRLEASSRPPSRAPSYKSAATSTMSTRSRRSLNPFSARSSQDQRWLSAAPLMLGEFPRSETENSTPQSQGVPPDPNAERLRMQREYTRVDKWRKMAKPVQASSMRKIKTQKASIGGGQRYEFDMKDRKLIRRVWKGIPDAWRAPAWYHFLSSTGRKSGEDAELTARYREYQNMDCAEDQQIHNDVHRTIPSHIMFRAECRGGQKALFQILRALTLEYPKTGYVQGMGTLAAMLLIYFDEETAFICACRLWQDRSIAELFDPEWKGLQNVLDVFEREWLSSSPLKQHLEEIGMVSMTYGVKWYITLFTYVLPFEAQLRVWDVIMLFCGRPDQGKTGHFNILHAIAAALMDALAPELQNAEYELAMERLTKPIPVENPDVLMRIANAEFYARRHR